MGAAGKARAKQVYDWSVILPDYKALWAELAEPRAKDSEIAAPADSQFADPLRDDPFRTFVGYPTSTISEDYIVQRRGTDVELEQLVRFDINSAVGGLVLDVTQMRALLATLPKADEHTSVGELLDANDVPHAPALRAILWLAKLGIVSLSKPAD